MGKHAGRPRQNGSGLRRGAVELLDGSLELGASGHLDALAGRDLDLGAGLRVAARASSGVDLLEGDPARDGDLAALGNGVGDRGEQRVEDTGDVAWLWPVALAMLATSSVLVMDLSAMSSSSDEFPSHRCGCRSGCSWSSDRLECTNHHPHFRVISRVLGNYWACRVTFVTPVTDSRGGSAPRKPDRRGRGCPRRCRRSWAGC